MAKRHYMLLIGVLVTGEWLRSEIEDFRHREDPCGEATILYRSKAVVLEEERERWSKSGLAVRKSCNIDAFHYGILRRPAGL